MILNKYFQRHNGQPEGLWWLLVVVTLILNFTPSNGGRYTNACRSIHGRLGTCVPLASCPMFYGWLKVRPVLRENLRLLVKYTCYFDNENPKVCCPNNELFREPEEEDPFGIRLATPVRRGVDSKSPSTNKLLFPEPSLSFPSSDLKRHQPNSQEPFSSSSTVNVEKREHVPLSFPTERSVASWNSVDKDPFLTRRDLRQHRNFRLIPKISECSNAVKIDSQNGAYGTHPWIALVGIKRKRSRSLEFEHICAGAIINNRYILTAAHCFVQGRPNLKNVRLGEYNLETLIDEGSELLPQSKREDYHIEKVTIHPEYHTTHKTNDIALIRVDKPISLNATFIKAACLPFVTEYELENRLNISHFKSMDGKAGWVAGWSRHSWDGLYSTGSDSHVLQEGFAEFTSPENCKRDYPNFFVSPKTQICVGGKGRRNSCVVDSGGPLLYPIKVPSHVQGFVEPKFFLLGLLSRGPTGAECRTDAAADNGELTEKQRDAASRLLPTSVFTDVSKYLPWILDNMHE